MTIAKKLPMLIGATLFAITAAGSAQAVTLFSGTGTPGATDAFNAMKAAIGGQANAGGPKANGFRTISWDGVRLDGTDINPNTKVIVPGTTVNIPVDRFLGQGALYAEEYTVSGDGFASVNPATAGQFPAFSPKNTFAMFDDEPGEFEDRFIEQSFTLAGTRTAAGTRGFGAIFVDVELAKSSSIEYFNGSTSLGKFFVDPAPKSGDPSFLGVLFDAPIVTDVTLTVGDKALFNFDGKTIRSFGAEDLLKGIDLAVTDDFIYAEPTTIANVPEPGTNLGLLVLGGMGALALLKSNKNKQKIAG
ncbi:hypothetical protein [Microseira sp. BLCC-F43]|jgi:hypothetical protein|uniref:hypothetical protein n=1 Tax=Microseira sp. BLCC-F43 TaxID=3153602 RepID=UPI0035B6CEF6